MAFFEDFGRKLSGAGQGVAQSGRNAVDIARLNSSISDRRKQIAQLFSIMGEKYYELHKDDPEAELSEEVSQVTGFYEDIVQFEEQISIIRGVVRCPNCGEDVPLGSAFCPSCGKPMPKDEPVEEKPPVECPHCHSLVPADSAFCNVCGASLKNREEDSDDEM